MRYTSRMGLFSFKKSKGTSIAVIDINSASVGGAYVRYEEGALPVIYYTARVDVEPREGEPILDSMMRSLSFLEQLMVLEGAPALRRETGDGSVERVLVSVSAPWQETEVATTHLEEKKPFTFTHAHLDAVGNAPLKKDRIRSGRTVIATVLNGYETPNPFGKRVTRADLVVLSSSLEKEAARQIEASIRRAFHTGNIELAAFSPASYTVFRDLYPHQKDFLLLDVSGSGTDVALVKRGMLVETRTVSYGTHDLERAARKAGQRAHLGADQMLDPEANKTFAEEAEAIERVWLTELKEVLAAFSGTRALPRTLFLLAHPSAREYLKRSLEGSELKSLWLSDEPLSVIAVSPANLATKVTTRGLGEGDLYLAVLALYAAKKGNEPS